MKLFGLLLLCHLALIPVIANAQGTAEMMAFLQGKTPGKRAVYTVQEDGHRVVVYAERKSAGRGIELKVGIENGVHWRKQVGTWTIKEDQQEIPGSSRRRYERRLRRGNQLAVDSVIHYHSKIDPDSFCETVSMMFTGKRAQVNGSGFIRSISKRSL
jgi:hypothetical protein